MTSEMTRWLDAHRIDPALAADEIVGIGNDLLDGCARRIDPDLDRAAGRDDGVAPQRDEAPRGDRRRLAVHEAGHVAVGVALFGAGAVTSSSLLPNGGITELGAIAPFAALPDPSLLDAVAVHYGGVAAERLLLGAPTASARDDVRRATRLLLSRVDSGVEEGVPPLAIGELDRPSERALALRDASLARRADAAMAVAEAAVDAARPAVLAFAAALETAGSLCGPALSDAIRDAGFPSAADVAEPAQLAEAA